MTIQQYLLENHLKPLFIFKLNDENSPECFGIFVGSKGKDSTNVNFGDLIWDHNSDAKPSWFNETPLWIIPLSTAKENDLYGLRFNDPKFPNNDLVLPNQFNSCYISIIGQEKGTGWNSYTNLKPDEPLKFSHYLNFEGTELNLSDKTPFTRHSITEKVINEGKVEDNVLTVWLTDADKISTTTKLLNFNGIQCEIVDEEGKKHDFGIWVGIRDKKDNDFDKQNKIVLSINSSDDQVICKDCPIVWRKEGLLDDAIFPTVSTDKIHTQFGLINPKFELNSNSEGKLAESIAKIVFNNLTPNNYYSWFIKEDNQISPFFRYINKGKERRQLSIYLDFNDGYNEINFFQVNRCLSGDFSKNIISWCVAKFKPESLVNIFKKHAVSNYNILRSQPFTITPEFKTFNFSEVDQVVLEHKINSGKIALTGFRLFNPNTPQKTTDLISTNQTIKLPNLRLRGFERKKLLLNNEAYSEVYDLNDYFDFQTMIFSAKGIDRQSDNGTLFGFKIETKEKKDNSKPESGVFNDGTFSFTLDSTQNIEGKIYFSLQLQKAQKPLYLWEWYEELEKKDTIIPCFSIEDFKLPVSLITPLSSDLSQQDRFIADDDSSSLASSGNLRPTTPLIIPLLSENSRKYYLSLSENINVGQDYNFSAEIEVNNDQAQQDTKKSKLGAVVLGSQPQTALKIETPFGTDPQQDNGKWIVARKNNLSADGGIWEILNEAANETGITVTFPPQIIGEAFRKTDKEVGNNIIEGEPVDDKLVQFKFGPPAKLQIANEQLNRQLVTAPWNLRYLFGSYGDSNPGLRLLKAQFELLYGMSANFENKDAFIAELENKLGQLVKAPRGRIVWQSNKEQNEAFEKAYADFVRMLKLFSSRLAIYEVSGKDKFQPAKFTDGIDYFLRVENVENKVKGAQLKWPFVDKNGKDLIPDYLQEIHDKYHTNKGLAGGFHFGFESMAVYKEFWGAGLKKGSSSGEIENLAFTSQGGYGKQIARFNNDKTIIKSTTSLGRTHFYAVERIGRIGVFWNKAKHVIEYERTVVPSNQFKHTENTGRVIMRKVREFVEILEPERNYPEFGAEPSSAGSILGTRFKSKKIPVSSSWGNEVLRSKEPIGWQVPLWNPNADKSVYPFPQIMLSVLASKESHLTDVLCNLANPENLYFYTDVRENVGDRLITAATNDWPSVLDIDYTLQPFEHIYQNAEPCLDKNDTKLVNTPLPSPIDILPGFERYTFRIVPSDVLISANGAYNKDSQVVGKLRTVTMQRQPIVKKDKDIFPEGKISVFSQNHVNVFHNYLSEKIQGYTDILKHPEQLQTDKIRDAIASHFSMVHQADKTFDEIVKNFNQEPILNYLNRASSDDLNVKIFNSRVKNGKTPPQEEKAWEIPTTALWFVLTKEVDEGIAAIDKNFNLLFGEVQKELSEIQEKVSKDIKVVVLDRIASFKNNLTDLKSHIEINLNGLDKLLKTETKKIDSFFLVYSDIEKELSKFMRDAAAAIDAIPDPATTLDEFKIKVNAEIENKIFTTLDEQLVKLKVNNHIKSIIKQRVIKEKITVEVTKFLNKLDAGTFILVEAKAAIKVELEKETNNAKFELTVVKNKLKKEVEGVSGSIAPIIKEFEEILDTEQTKVIAVIEVFENKIKAISDTIERPSAEIKIGIDEFFKSSDNKKFDRVNEIIGIITPVIQAFLIKNYKKDERRNVPPLAHIFDQGDQWLKEQITDFKTLAKNLFGKTEEEIKKFIDENLPQLKEIYDEIVSLEKLIASGNSDAIIKKANELSQAISKDFGVVMGDVTRYYYNAVDLNDAYKKLDQEVETVLFNYRSVFEEIKAVDLGFNRQTVELVFNFKETKAPRLLLTPVMGKLQKLNAGLNTMGISIPYAGLEEKFVAPLKEWGEKFTKSLAQEFPISNLLNDLGGIKFDNLFPFLKGDDAFMKAVKITHDLDKDALKAWVKADVDYTFKDDNTFMNIGPVKVTMLRNARITAQAYEYIDIDRNRTSENTGALKATFEISLSGTPLMMFKETVVSFKNGKYDFDLDPSRMEMPGLMKLLTDASKNIQTAAPADDGKGSPFKLEILKINRKIGDKDFELPIGAKATLDLPPLSIGGGPTSMSNLSFGGNFIMQAIDDTNLSNLKLDFMVGLGFYFGKRDLPFNFTAFILGGGGFIECNFRYKPSVSGAIQVNFVMSVHGSAALSLSAGWISGTIMILAGIEVEYNSGTGGGARIEIFVAIIGVVDILGLISIYLGLRLSINYLSKGNETVLYGVGTVKCKIKICAFVTIKVNRSHTTILSGESKSVSNSRSESISASLN
jgi:hypothetical protein